jgi:hypothetical protein
MKRSLSKDEYLRQYVLGIHDPDEQFEERLLTDKKLLEQLSIVEDEIVQEYLSGALSESEREKFESRFLATDAGKQALQFSKAFKNYFAGLPAAEKRTPLRRSWKRFLPSFLRGKSPILRISFAMVIIIVVCLGLLVFLRNRSQERGTIFTATLTPGQEKGIGGREMTVVEVPPGTALVRLQLAIGEASAESYHVSLFTDRGAEIFTEDGLQAESTATGKFVSVNVPSSILSRGDYRLKLSARISGNQLEDVASYSFRVYSTLGSNSSLRLVFEFCESCAVLFCLR